MFDFTRLIKKYGKVKPFKATVTGYYDYTNGGEWTQTVAWVEFEGAVVPITDIKTYKELGYDENDKKLYTYLPIAIGYLVKHKDIEYKVMSKKDYADFDDGADVNQELGIYMLKRGGV